MPPMPADLKVQNPDDGFLRMVKRCYNRGVKDALCPASSLPWFAPSTNVPGESRRSGHSPPKGLEHLTKIQFYSHLNVLKDFFRGRVELWSPNASNLLFMETSPKNTKDNRIGANSCI